MYSPGTGAQQSTAALSNPNFRFIVCNVVLHPQLAANTVYERLEHHALHHENKGGGISLHDGTLPHGMMAQ
jgi:hypothetical protein